MKKGVLSLAFIPLLLLSSCGEVDTNSDVCSITELTSSFPRETYDNSYGKDRIPDYWDSYGCGDGMEVKRHAHLGKSTGRRTS